MSSKIFIEILLVICLAVHSEAHKILVTSDATGALPHLKKHGHIVHLISEEEEGGSNKLDTADKVHLLKTKTDK